MTHALRRNESPFDGRLQSREQISTLRRQRDRRVEEVLVGVGMRQVGELRDERCHLEVDVVVALEKRLDQVENGAQELTLEEGRLGGIGFRFRRRRI